MDKRTRARELAMQLLYQLDIQANELFSYLDDFLIENESDDTVRRLAKDWTKAAWENIEECDALIVDSTIKWKLSRLSPVDKSILRLATYQLNHCCDIPPKVTINEAIELAKKFSTAQSPGFVNGVLDAIYRKIKAQQSE